MDFADQQKAAAAYRRSGMSWREIGRRLGVDRDRIQKALADRGQTDGWGDTLIRPAKKPPSARHRKRDQAESST